MRHKSRIKRLEQATGQTKKMVVVWQSLDNPDQYICQGQAYTFEQLNQRDRLLIVVKHDR